ncbi:MAG: hypothetical protein WAQ98_22010 [Blastocatellia bacterium]
MMTTLCYVSGQRVEDISQINDYFRSEKFFENSVKLTQDKVQASVSETINNQLSGCLSEISPSVINGTPFFSGWFISNPETLLQSWNDQFQVPWTTILQDTTAWQSSSSEASRLQEYLSQNEVTLNITSKFLSATKLVESSNFIKERYAFGVTVKSLVKTSVIKSKYNSEIFFKISIDITYSLANQSICTLIEGLGSPRISNGLEITPMRLICHASSSLDQYGRNIIDGAWLSSQPDAPNLDPNTGNNNGQGEITYLGSYTEFNQIITSDIYNGLSTESQCNSTIVTIGGVQQQLSYVSSIRSSIISIARSN